MKIFHPQSNRGGATTATTSDLTRGGATASPRCPMFLYHKTTLQIINRICDIFRGVISDLTKGVQLPPCRIFSYRRKNRIFPQDFYSDLGHFKSKIRQFLKKSLKMVKYTLDL